MLTEEQRKKALASLNELSEIAKSLTGEKVEDDKDKNPLRKSLDSVLGTMEKLVKGEGEETGGEAGGEAGKEAGDGETGGEAGDGETGANTEKSLSEENDIVKSLTEQDADFVEAYESSELVKGLCTAIQNQNKAIDKINGQISKISKSITAIEKGQGDFYKSFTEVKKAEASLMKSVHETVEKIGGQPLPRKSSQPTDASPLEKSFLDSERLNNAGHESSGGANHGQRVDALNKAIENNDGRISLQEATNFELTGQLTPGVKAVLTEAKLV